jgi:hypothetical protein
VPFTGSAVAARATSADTSAAATGWIRASGARTSSPTTNEPVIASVNSWNCVTRTIVYGRPESTIVFSCTTLALM